MSDFQSRYIVDMSPQTLLGNVLRQSPEVKPSKKTRDGIADALLKFSKDIRSGNVVALRCSGGPKYVDRYDGGKGQMECRPSRESYFTIDFYYKQSRRKGAAK